MLLRLQWGSRRMVSVSILLGLTLIAVTLIRFLPGYADDAIPPGFRAVPLKNLRAADFAAEARAMLAQAKSRAEIIVDSQLNRVLVRGSDEAQRLVYQLAETVDRPEAATPNQEANGDTVRGYRVAPELMDSLVSRLQKKFPASTKAKIAPDRRTNQIVVVAPVAIQSQVDEFVRQEAQKLTGGTGPSSSGKSSTPTQSNVYQFQNISWREFEDSLRALWGGGVSVSVSRNGELAAVKMPQLYGDRELVQIDRRNDQVNIPGGDGVTRSWQRLISAMDGANPNPNSLTQLAALNKADPNKIQKAVNLMVAAAEQQRIPNRTTAAIPIGDQDANRNLVARVFQNPGQEPEPKPATKNGAQPNQAQPAQARPNEPAKPAEAAGIDVDDAGGLIGDVQLEFIPELGILVVKGHKRDVERVMKLIEKIEETSKETQPDIRVILLQHANSEAVATMLTDIYEDIFLPRQGVASITGLGKPNAVLLIGRKEALEILANIIAQLDQPVDPTTQFEVFQLKYTAAADAQTAINTFFEERTGLGPRVLVVPETRSNSLIVQASPRDMAEVRAIIAKIDVGTTPSSHEVKIFRLKNALAQELATVIQDAITGAAARTTAGQGQGQGFQGTGQGGAQQARQNALQFIMVDPEAGRFIRSGILSDVRVRADTNGNALLVTAPTESMELIGRLIDLLDNVPGGEAQLKVFTIENGDATTLAQMLQLLFGQQVTIGQGTTGGIFGGFGGAQLAQQQAGAGGAEGSLVPLRFAIDARTNSIIATGSASDLRVVGDVLLRLDIKDVATRRMHVYRLKNAFAEDVATSVSGILTAQRQILQQNQLLNVGVPAFEQVQSQVLVVAEPASNSVIVSATPRYFDDVIRVIDQLDFRPPMVLVKVLIAEVQLGDLYEFGIEMGLQDSLVFDRGKAALNATGYDTAGNPGFNFNNAGLPNVNNRFQGTTAGQSITGFGLGRANTNTGYGGLVLSAASESISVLLRAMQESGKIQILSAPEVMAIHNRQANVLVGEDVPRVTGSTINQQGNVQNTVVDTSVGLILNIIPQINNDGIVILNVQAERSGLGPENQGIQIATTPQGAPIRQPRINRTSATTTISARSGQTVVFAGLISDDKNVLVRRVPFLSDIPVIGELFKFTTDNEVRRELLIVLTPHIVRSDDDYDWVKAIESERMNWCLGDVVNVYGDVGLRGGSCLFCNSRIPVIYPDSNPVGIGGMPPGAIIEEHPYIGPSSSPEPFGSGYSTGPQSSAAPPEVSVDESTAPAMFQSATNRTLGPVPPPNYQNPARSEVQPAPPIRLGRRSDKAGNTVAPASFDRPNNNPARR